MPLSDTDIQRIVAELQRQSIGNAARLVAEQARAKTGVVAGGPYGSVCVDAQGRVTWAGAGGVGLAAHYAMTASSTMAGTFTGVGTVGATETVIDYDSMVYDPGNLVTAGSAWKFTAADAGYYLLFAMFNLRASNWNAGDNDVYLFFTKNGSGTAVQTIADRNHINVNNETIYLSGHGFVQLNAADYIQPKVGIYIGTGGSTSVTLSRIVQKMYITILRVT
jgi:hypothetical protein